VSLTISNQRYTNKGISYQVIQQSLTRDGRRGITYNTGDRPENVCSICAFNSDTLINWDFFFLSRNVDQKDMLLPLEWFCRKLVAGVVVLKSIELKFIIIHPTSHLHTPALYIDLLEKKSSRYYTSQIIK
jgi:hypothetical protein